MSKKVTDNIENNEELTQEEKAIERNLAKQERSMKAILDAEKKVPIFIPESPLNPNEVVPVSINGVTYAIPTGEQFMVPESIYNVWKYSYDETRKANIKMQEVLNKELKIY